jgi:two-component system, OmpR family, response regulator RpaA
MTTPVQRVLIADDDPDIRALLVMTLELSGYSVTEAEDGAQAGALAKELQPDLIVADVMMPVTDGFDLLENLKADQATMDIPVVILTARASDKDVWRGWQAGASYYITKPFDPDHLIRYIEHLDDPDGHPLPC